MKKWREEIDLYIVKVAFGHRPNYELAMLIAALIIMQISISL